MASTIQRLDNRHMYTQHPFNVFPCTSGFRTIMTGEDHLLRGFHFKLLLLTLTTMCFCMSCRFSGQYLRALRNCVHKAKSLMIHLCSSGLSRYLSTETRVPSISRLVLWSSAFITIFQESLLESSCVVRNLSFG